MPTDPLTGSRYPASTAAPNVPQDIQNAVLDLSDNTIPRFATTSARDSGYSAYVSAGGVMADGLHCWVAGQGDMVYLSGSWGQAILPGTVVSYGSVTTNLASDGTTTEQRIAGGLNQTPILIAGRAYKVKARGVLNGNFAGAQVSFNVRGVIGTGTPTNTSTCLASVGAGIDTVGAAGRIPLSLEGIFNASTSGTYTISPFMKTSSGVLTLVTDDRGRADLWVEDAGLSVSGAVSL